METSIGNGTTNAELQQWVRDARQFTLSLVEDLSPQQLIGQKKESVNPTLWHMGHIGWFQENWVLRHRHGAAPIRPKVDELFDSFEVPHVIRWELELPTRSTMVAYLQEVEAHVLEQLEEKEDPENTYFNSLTVFHEDMHDEAIVHDRQTLRFPPPPPVVRTAAEELAASQEAAEATALNEDVEVPGADAFMLGATPDIPFVFDNEKWAYPVKVKPFRIARAAVTNAEFAEFVDDRGYEKPKLWSIAGNVWLAKFRARHPVYWRRQSGRGWYQRDFDHWRPLKENHPLIHVNWFEAEAFCNWAGRRLPREAEWEMAAAAEPGPHGGIRKEKRPYPWGQEKPTGELANLNNDHKGTIGVADLPAGESAFGCRQMLGNVWEWTADSFYPYPGFVLDPYKEYSAPWFGYHKVLRGGSWVTRARLIRNTWRNYFLPDRGDIPAGFRTCAK